MTKTFGIDDSHWEGHIDWELAAPEVPWAIHKATEGTGFVDSEFLNNKQGCIANHVPFGAYHFNRPNFDAVLQANHFVNTVGDNCHVYVADIETTVLAQAVLNLQLGQGIAASDDNILEAIKAYRGLGEYPPELKSAMDFEFLMCDYAVGTDSAITGIVDNTKAFLDRVEHLTNRKPTIYTSPGFWNTYFNPAPPWTDDYDLWVAHWGMIEPTLPHGWTSYKIHQWGTSGRIPGIPGACDQNWFNGDLNEVWDYFGYEVPPPPGPRRIAVNVANLNIRNAPVVTPSTVIGLTTYGKIWEITGEVRDTQGRIWLKSGPSAHLASWLCREL